MGEDDLNLIGRVAIKHGITQDNAARIAQSHEGGIGSRCLATQLHRENAAHSRMCAVG